MISATFLFGCEDIDRVGVGHKMVDTFEKMDAINPTFDLGRVCNVLDRVMKIRFMYFPTLTIYSGLSHLFNKRIPILTRRNCSFDERSRLSEVKLTYCGRDHLSNTPRY
jgi:hypothetical protein